MDRRKKLATAGAVSLTATAAIVALASSVGLFGLTNDSPRVGKLSPIDATHATGTPSNGSAGAEDAHATTSTTTNTIAEVNDDRGGDDHHGPGSSNTDDNRGPGSTSSGRDHDDD